MTTPPIPEHLQARIDRSVDSTDPAVRQDLDRPVPDMAPSDDCGEDTPPPLSLEQIKAQVRFRHQNAVEMLDALRKQRKALDAQIRSAVIEETEARRMARALEPRKPRSKAAKK